MSSLWSSASASEDGYPLSINLSSVSFSHHPLFSAEHVLAARLGQTFGQHRRWRERDLGGYLAERLAGLRRAVHDLRRELREAVSPCVCVYVCAWWIPCGMFWSWGLI